MDIKLDQPRIRAVNGSSVEGLTPPIAIVHVRIQLSATTPSEKTLYLPNSNLRNNAVNFTEVRLVHS